MSQFGQPPLAAYLPLRAGQNLADLPDKPAALANLGTLSTSDIMLNSVPIGTIIPFWGNTAPVGYLPCNGQTVNSGTFPDLVTFLGGGSSQALPDLRGEFLRGWDNGRGVDVGRAIKTAQSSQNLSHTHDIMRMAAFSGNTSGAQSSAIVADNGVQVPTTVSGVIFSSGGNESRPRNISVLYCMKAYGALVNTSTANIGNVLTELSQTAKITQFDSSLGSNGYQKLPNGMIMQWGNTATVAGSITVTLPITFPVANLMAMASESGAAGWNSSVLSVYGTHTKTVSNFGIKNLSWNGSSFSASAGAVCWIAIGY